MGQNPDAAPCLNQAALSRERGPGHLPCCSRTVVRPHRDPLTQPVPKGHPGQEGAFAEPLQCSELKHMATGYCQATGECYECMCLGWWNTSHDPKLRNFCPAVQRPCRVSSAGRRNKPATGKAEPQGNLSFCGSLCRSSHC